MNIRQLFFDLYNASVEKEVDDVLNNYGIIQNPSNWCPYGGNESNFGVIENQQASPIPALIEKITNGIDAILMRKSYEQSVDPRSDQAPRSIDEALQQFFPDHKNWDLRKERLKQAERLQILADGPRGETSLIVYDDGEGQAPEDFENSFLSLLRGNKNDIHFVQGKYNMGGTGAIVFCGQKRYQLIASKRYDNGQAFGFTLVRRHPLSTEEDKKKKSTWYEYLVIGGKIPSFTCGELELGLYKRRFTTGTVIKLYSYDLPSGSRSVISRDLNQSINEYLFQPALPILTIDNKKRYPDDRNLQRELYGLKRRLEEEDSRYIDEFFSENITDHEIGEVKVTCYVFKTRVDQRSVKETRDTLRREFFKNNMSILFSVNGQVHGHYTSEFITRSLKFSLLKNYLLVHVDCTEVNTEFRNELFMASRDRLKEGDKSTKLRHKLAEILSKSRLKDIHKNRKASITVEGNDAEDLMRNIARNFPIRNELAQLLSQNFKLNDRREGKRRDKGSKTQDEKPDRKNTFNPKRYPSCFSIDVKQQDGEEFPMVQIPLGGKRTIKFSTDVEDQYFDRISDPGDIQIGLMNFAPNNTKGGDSPGTPKALDAIFDVVKSSPRNGTIRVSLNPTDEVKVGDAITIRVSLSAPEGQLEQIFLVKISESEKTPPKKPKKEEEPDTRLGLPEFVMVYQDQNRGKITWEKLEQNGIEMSHDVIVQLFEEEDSLRTVYINMDSKVLLSHRSKLTGESTIDIAEKRYVSAVYFHTLVLYTITKNRKYSIQQGEGEQNKSIPEYISDLFGTFYAQFLLNFDMQELVSALEA